MSIPHPIEALAYAPTAPSRKEAAKHIRDLASWLESSAEPADVAMMLETMAFCLRKPASERLEGAK